MYFFLYSYSSYGYSASMNNHWKEKKPWGPDLQILTKTVSLDNASKNMYHKWLGIKFSSKYVYVYMHAYIHAYAHTDTH